MFACSRRILKARSATGAWPKLIRHYIRSPCRLGNLCLDIPSLMTNDLSLNHVNDILGNVGGVVGDSFKIS